MDKLQTILAIDQSFTCSGIVILRDSQILHCEKLTTDKKADKFARSWEVAQRMLVLAKMYNPTILAMEGLAFGGVGNATRDLAGLQFVIATQETYVGKLKVELVSPGTVKKVATGKGNAKKPELLEHLPKDALKKFLDLGVKKTTGLMDLTDAYWIGRTVENVLADTSSK